MTNGASAAGSGKGEPAAMVDGTPAEPEPVALAPVVLGADVPDDVGAAVDDLRGVTGAVTCAGAEELGVPALHAASARAAPSRPVASAGVLVRACIGLAIGSGYCASGRH
ncbi:MAG: hypothetical protein M0013_09940 [Actinomycetota bacterium]|nr:hypothetical protein [Actinomycetota bacterium]